MDLHSDITGAMQGL